MPPPFSASLRRAAFVPALTLVLAACTSDSSPGPQRDAGVTVAEPPPTTVPPSEPSTPASEPSTATKEDGGRNADPENPENPSDAKVPDNAGQDSSTPDSSHDGGSVPQPVEPHVDANSTTDAGCTTACAPKCRDGLQLCDGACVDTRSDALHCGGCDVPCAKGFACSFGACQDVDECSLNNGECDPLTTCKNIPGGRECGACPKGYEGFGSAPCRDIDECESDHGGCDPLATCTNTPGGRECGNCPSGYEGDGERGCSDTNECAIARGGCDARTECVNEPGTHHCGPCPKGFTGTGETGCTNIDECGKNNGGCDPLTHCTDTEGSYVCAACPQGYTGDPKLDCIPLLQDLRTSIGQLTPTFSPETTNYRLALDLLDWNVSFSAVAPPGARVLVNGAALVGLSSPELEIPVGEHTQVTVEVAREGRGSRSYVVDVTRGESLRNYTVAPGITADFAVHEEQLVMSSYNPADQSRSVLVYDLRQDPPRLVDRLPAPEHSILKALGNDVSISESFLVVDGEKRVDIYEPIAGSWKPAGSIPYSDRDLYRLRGKRLAIPGWKKIDLYERLNSSWEIVHTILPPTDHKVSVFGELFFWEDEILIVRSDYSTDDYQWEVYGLGDGTETHEAVMTGDIQIQDGRIFRTTSTTKVLEVWDRSPSGGWSLSQTISSPVPGVSFPQDYAADNGLLIVAGNFGDNRQAAVYSRVNGQYVFQSFLRIAAGWETSWMADVSIFGDLVMLANPYDHNSSTGLNPPKSGGSEEAGVVHFFSRRQPWREIAWLARPYASVGERFGSYGRWRPIRSDTHLFITASRSYDPYTMIYRYAQGR